MENYSPQMQQDLERQLRKTETKDLQQMLAYFQQRQGPGLALVKAELDARVKQNIAA